MATPYGNYRSYYPRRRARSSLAPDRDERLALLPASWFEGKRVLDVGCNVGEVTVEVAQRFAPSLALGVDIDPVLVGQCRNTVERAFSMERPRALVGTSLDGTKTPSITANGGSEHTERPKKKQKRNKTKAEPLPGRTPSETHHFPRFFADAYGALSPLSHKVFAEASQGQSKALFPKNVRFEVSDWAVEDVEDDEGGWDVILALSLSKWIHLNHGDDGIVRFFRKCFDRLLPGGRLVLEKQDWPGYKQAKRGSEKLKQSYFELKLRPDDFTRILLEDVDFARREEVRDGAGKGFDRDIEVYVKE